jgi:NAD(P)-dependent dehydrogenase (short-subunit alcohol dehydrogenase family)
MPISSHIYLVPGMGFLSLFGVLLVALLGVCMVKPHMSFKTFPTPAAEPGSHVFITGASTGIGKHAALRLAAEGFTVFAGVRKASDGDALLLENPTLLPIIIDVANEQSVLAALAHVEKTLARSPHAQLVGLVNNAGITNELPLELQPIDRMRGVFEVNVFGLVRCTQTFLPLLRASKGRVVNIGSVAGLHTPAHLLFCSHTYYFERTHTILLAHILF